MFLTGVKRVATKRWAHLKIHQYWWSLSNVSAPILVYVMLWTPKIKCRVEMKPTLEEDLSNTTIRCDLSIVTHAVKMH